MNIALRKIFVCFIAVFALSAVAASAAVADPGQEFTNVPAKANIKGASGTSVLKAGTVMVVCTNDESGGVVATKMTFTGIVVTFTGCKSKDSSKACEASVNSKGAPAGDVVTTSLKGELGEDEALEATVVLLKPESGSEFVTLAANGCTLETKVTGSVAGKIPAGELNKKTKTMKLEFNVPGGKQEITEFENTADAKTTPGLKAFGVAATQETLDTITYEEEVEVKSGE